MRHAHLTNKDRLGGVVMGRINKPVQAFPPLSLVPISATLAPNGDKIKGTEKIRAIGDDPACGWTFVLAKQHHPDQGISRFGQPWEVLLWVQAVDKHGEWVSLA